MTVLVHVQVVVDFATVIFRFQEEKSDETGYSAMPAGLQSQQSVPTQAVAEHAPFVPVPPAPISQSSQSAIPQKPLVESSGISKPTPSGMTVGSGTGLVPVGSAEQSAFVRRQETTGDEP